jgi:hypothetical protein
MKQITVIVFNPLHSLFIICAKIEKALIMLVAFATVFVYPRQLSHQMAREL